MSMKWHPDRNQDVDVTSIMQDINEAYAILKDPGKRSRYDKEYASFQEQRYSNVSRPREDSTSNNSWNYDYDVHDETLKEDINEARRTAEELVNEFLNSLKTYSKNAAKGAWEGAKGYVYAAIILSIIGLVIGTCIHQNENTAYNYNDSATTYNTAYANVSKVSEQVSDSFQEPSSWTKYYIDNNAFSLSVPSTVELRNEYDAYTQRLKDLGFACNTDAVVFQQKGLSTNSKKALKRYCRILIQHNIGNSGDFLKCDETEPLDEEARNVFHDLVISELGSYELLNEPTYRWIDINGNKAVEIKYRRNGSNGNTTSCTMYLLFNYDEMVKMIVSYREQEKDIWLPDLDNMIKTFKWISNS